MKQKLKREPNRNNLSAEAWLCCLGEGGGGGGDGGGGRRENEGKAEKREGIPTQKKKKCFKDFGFASVCGHRNESDTKRVYVNRDIIRQQTMSVVFLMWATVMSQTPRELCQQRHYTALDLVSSISDVSHRNESNTKSYVNRRHYTALDLVSSISDVSHRNGSNTKRVMSTETLYCIRPCQ